MALLNVISVFVYHGMVDGATGSAMQLTRFKSPLSTTASVGALCYGVDATSHWSSISAARSGLRKKQKSRGWAIQDLNL